jgi:hypothetical protein
MSLMLQRHTPSVPAASHAHARTHTHTHTHTCTHTYTHVHTHALTNAAHARATRATHAHAHIASSTCSTCGVFRCAPNVATALAHSHTLEYCHSMLRRRCFRASPQQAKLECGPVLVLTPPTSLSRLLHSIRQLNWRNNKCVFYFS